MLILLWLYLNIPYTFGQQRFFWEKYRQDENAEELPDRLLTQMRSYYEDASQRITELNPMRFLYEESPHYETGYVMHEVIERYKKMVEELTRLMKFNSTPYFDAIDRLEVSQKLYFEVYHLTNMIHEIPRKWKAVPEFDVKEADEAADDGGSAGGGPGGKPGESPGGRPGGGPSNRGELAMNLEAMKEEQMKKRTWLKLQQKLAKQRREKIKKGLALMTPKPSGRPYKLHWPLDYGWEIDEW